MGKIKTNGKDHLVTESILDRALNEQSKRNFTVFATKQDLKEGLKELEEKQNWKFDKLLVASEKIYAKLEKKELEDAAHSYMHKTVEDRLADHDKRLGQIERARA